VLAQAASGFLDRAGRIYPSQLLGIVQAGGRVYLVNARDDGWSERVRLGLMELRLAEPDITAARRFQGAASGAVPMEIPAGDYACLASERAARQGLALDGRGRMSLAPGKSVHLVDPREWTIVVEVKAVGTEPLDFREILALSGHSGIYAGLSSRRARSSSGNSVEGAGGVIEVAIEASGRPGGEVVITPRSREGEEKAVAVAAVPPAQASVAVAPAVVSEPPAGMAKAGAIQQAPVTAGPVVIVEPPVQAARADMPARLPPASTTQPVRSRSTQSYDEYAKAMKSMLALRRSGGVRSVSEITYVHPAIEDLRNFR
jgi:hypothetical protein